MSDKFFNQPVLPVPPTNQKAGISTEFAHEEVYLPVRDLIPPMANAVKIRSEDPVYILANEKLNQCASNIGNAIGIEAPGQSNTDYKNTLINSRNDNDRIIPTSIKSTP